MDQQYRNAGQLNATGDQRDDGCLFRIMVPHPERFSRCCDSRQQPPPTVVHASGATVLHWEDLRISGEGASGVSAEVHIAPGDDDEIRFELCVSNNGPDDVLDVWFPILGGWTGLGGKGRDTMILGAYSEFDPHGFPYFGGTTYARQHQRRSIGYPGTLYAPWIDLSGPGGGLSYLLYDQIPRNGFVACENMAGYHGGPLRLMYGWVSQTEIKPGACWHSAPVGISVHAGDWHATADRYRRWMERWCQAPPTSPRLRTSIGFQNVFFRGFDGEPFRELSTVPEVAAIGRRYGVDHLCVWDYVTMGNYSKHSDRDVLDWHPAECEVLMAGLRRAADEGSNVNALINFRLTDPTSTLYHEHAHQEVTHDCTGLPRCEGYPATHAHPGDMFARHLGPYSHVCSPFAPGYRQRVLRQVAAYCALGFTSMFYDQPLEMADYTCWAEGALPERTQAAQASLLAEVRQLMHAHSPEAYLIGELCDAFTSQYVDLWMSWYPMLAQALRSVYSLPRTLQSWVVDNDAGQASHAFALGMQLCLCTHGSEGTLADVPAFGAHVAQLAALRHRLAPWLSSASFRDHEGLAVTADSDATAYRFQGPLGPVIIAVAPNESGTLRVALTDTPKHGPGTGMLYRLAGDMQAVQGMTLDVTLARAEVAVWIPRL